MAFIFVVIMLKMTIIYSNSYKEVVEYVFACKKTHHIRVSYRLGLFDNYGVKFGIPIGRTNDGLFISEYFGDSSEKFVASDYFTADQNTILQRYSRDDDNPILLFYSLKDF